MLNCSMDNVYVSSEDDNIHKVYEHDRNNWLKPNSSPLTTRILEDDLSEQMPDSSQTNLLDGSMDSCLLHPNLQNIGINLIQSSDKIFISKLVLIVNV